MRIYFSILFISLSLLTYSQEKLIKKKHIQARIIEVVSDGLDDIQIENSTNNELEVILYDENPNTHNILLSEERNKIIVDFNLNFESPLAKEVFRKYITKRLQRARVVLKVPINKEIVIHGKTIGITSKSYQGDISIYIDKGNIKLNKVQGNLAVTLFQGNIYGEVFRSKLNLKTNKGIIKLNAKEVKSPFIQENKKNSKECKINSINANINLLNL